MKFYQRTWAVHGPRGVSPRAVAHVCCSCVPFGGSAELFFRILARQTTGFHSLFRKPPQSQFRARHTVCGPGNSRQETFYNINSQFCEGGRVVGEECRPLDVMGTSTSFFRVVFLQIDFFLCSLARADVCPQDRGGERQRFVGCMVCA